MSYEIIYSRNFIKTPKGYLLLCLSGSSNCTEYKHGKERRERNWRIWTRRDGFVSEAETIQDLKELYSSYYSSGSVEYKSKRFATADEEIKFYQNGFKNAKTIEEYIQHGNFTDTSGHTYKVNCLIVKLIQYKEGGVWTETDKQIITTTAALIDAIETLKDKTKASKIWLDIAFNDNEPITCKTPKQISGQCLLKYKSYYYKERTESGWRWTKDKNDAFIFNDAAAAEATAHESYWPNYQIIKYTQTKQTEKNCMLHIIGSGYFIRFTKYGIKYSYYKTGGTQMDEKRASQTLEKLQKNWKNKSFEIVKINTQTL